MGRRGNLGGVRQDKVEAIILSASLYSGDFTTARAGGHTLASAHTECGGHSAAEAAFILP
jgi:hypothetical protein